MFPFRDSVKHNQTFKWNKTLHTLFLESKKIILEKITESIHAFDPSRQTCLQTDWSRNRVGYLLLQKHCSCEPTNNRLSVYAAQKDGNYILYAGSRSISGCESRYSPTEGEALAVSWDLYNARLFVLGCPNLIVVTDHKPLLGILQR